MVVHAPEAAAVQAGGVRATYTFIMCFSKMQTDFSLFQERLQGACRIRDMSVDTLCNSSGLSSYEAGLLNILGIKALDIFELAQIAGTLEVSVDWLLGRTDQMELLEPKGAPISSGG
jgi:hypothetical protein